MWNHYPKVKEILTNKIWQIVEIGVDAYLDGYNSDITTTTEKHTNCAIISCVNTQEVRVVSMKNLFYNYDPLPSKDGEPKLDNGSTDSSKTYPSYAEQAGIPQ